MTAALPEDPAQLRVLCKPSLYARKPTWAEVALADVPAMVAGWDPQAFATGQVALWLSPRADTAQGRAYMPWLDVESPDAHGDVAANIETAQGLLLRLAEAGLNLGLEVILTGNGFRFCWPFAVEPELAAPFMAMIRDKARWPGIDAGPQTSGVPLALAGYRGHRSQGGKGDLHFARLEDPSELLTLTEKQYSDMVKGPADLAACQTPVGVLRPTSWTPPAWRAVLAEYQRDLALRRHVVKIRFPARPEGPRRVSWAAIEDHLAARGVRILRELEADGRPVRLLSECPSCGRKHKAWLTAGATLKCWSSSCEAGQYATGLDGVPFRQGLRLAAWAPALTPSEDMVEPERHETPGETMTVDQARLAIREALAGDDDVIIRAAAGTGKSFAALAYALAEAEKGRLVLFSSPETALAVELETKAVEMAGRLELAAPILRFEGRNKANCARVDECNDLAARGFSPSLLVCPRCTGRDSCAYRAQFEQLKAMKTGVVFCAHAATPAVVGKIGKRLAAWLVDETCLDTFMRSMVVPDGSMRGLRVKLVGKAEDVLRKTAAAAEKIHDHIPEKGSHQGRLYGGDLLPPGDWAHTGLLWESAGITAEERETLAGDLAYFDQHEDEKPSTWQKRLLKEKVDPAALTWWRVALAEAPGRAYVHVIRHAKNQISYRAQIIATPPATCRVINLDATGSAAEMAALFGREFRVVDARVSPPAGSRFVHLNVAMGKCKTAGAEDKLLEKYLGRAISYLRPGDKKVLLATHFDAEERLLAMARRLDPGRHWDSMHHWSGRGRNAWADFDAQVVLGTPTPRRSALLDREMTLFDGDQAARDEWFTGLSYRDLVQTTARTRPVLQARTIVVVGRHWPGESLGAPSFIVDARRKGGAAEAEEEAYRRLLALGREFGLVFSELAAVAGIFEAHDKDGLAEWEERIRPLAYGETPLEFAPTLIKSVLIRVRSNSEGVLEPVLLGHRGHSWPRLLARLADELGLPELTYRPGHRGRPQAALGSLPAVRRFCETNDLPFDAALWAGIEEKPVMEDTTPEAAPGRRLTAAELIEWPPIHTPPADWVDPGHDPDWNPWRMAAAAEFSDYGKDPELERVFYAWERREAALAAMAVA